MIADDNRAAIAAAETLVKYNMSDPLQILKCIPGVLVLSYTDMSIDVELDRQHVISTYGENNHDAITAVVPNKGRLHYIVTYNKQLPDDQIRHALARELGHIILHHDGSLPEDIRNDEANLFADCLLSERI